MRWQYTIIACIGIAIMFLGGYMQYESITWQPSAKSGNIVPDTTVTETVITDTVALTNISKKFPFGFVKNKTTTRISTGKETDTSHTDRSQQAYNYILLGLFIIVFAIILPSIQEFSILNLFSAKFRERLEQKKEENNELEQSLATPRTAQPQPDDFEETHDPTALEGAMPRKYLKYKDDIQRGQWGGKAEVNNRKLSAIVTQDSLNANWFNVELKVESTAEAKPLAGKVTFHLHQTFVNRDPVIYVTRGKAILRIKAYGAFTVGAEADRGETKLELDLAKIPLASELFKIR